MKVHHYLIFHSTCIKNCCNNSQKVRSALAASVGVFFGFVTGHMSSIVILFTASISMMLKLLSFELAFWKVPSIYIPPFDHMSGCFLALA